MSRISSLDEPADLNAEHGSKTWARGVARKLQLEVKKLDSDVSTVQGWIEIAAENEVWRVLGYMSLDAFLIAEANFTPGILDAIRTAKSGTIREAIQEAKANPARGEKGGAPKGNKNASKNEHNIGNSKVVLPGGTNNKRTLARLARDGYEELLDAIETGELSVNAAAIRVGYRKRKTPAELALANFRKCEDRLEPLKAIVAELEPHERAVVAQWLAGG